MAQGPSAHMLDDVALDAIRQHIMAGEARTRGEIVCMVVRQVIDFALVGWCLAVGAGLLLPWVALALTRLPALDLLAMQLAVTLLLGLLLGQASGARLLWPPARLSARVRREAQWQFAAHHLDDTSHRAGVMLFIALAERRIEIIADPALDSAIDPASWAMILDPVADQLRRGDLVAAIQTGIAGIADALARAAPGGPDDANELPDVIVR